MFDSFLNEDQVLQPFLNLMLAIFQRSMVMELILQKIGRDDFIHVILFCFIEQKKNIIPGLSGMRGARDKLNIDVINCKERN